MVVFFQHEKRSIKEIGGDYFFQIIEERITQTRPKDMAVSGETMLGVWGYKVSYRHVPTA